MNDIKKGQTILLDGHPYIVVTADFLKKQQRRPVVRSVLKNLKTGQSKEHTFMQSDRVKAAVISRQQYQFLYRQKDTWQFMEPNTYEQVTLRSDEVGAAAIFLIAGQAVKLLLFDNQPLTVELPVKIVRQVITAPPNIKGDTSTNVMQEVEIEGGVKIKAPLFIKTGDSIKIDTRNSSYVERVSQVNLEG